MVYRMSLKRGKRSGVWGKKGCRLAGYWKKAKSAERRAQGKERRAHGAGTRNQEPGTRN